MQVSDQTRETRVQVYHTVMYKIYLFSLCVQVWVVFYRFCHVFCFFSQRLRFRFYCCLCSFICRDSSHTLYLFVGVLSFSLRVSIECFSVMLLIRSALLCLCSFIQVSCTSRWVLVHLGSFRCCVRLVFVYVGSLTQMCLELSKNTTHNNQYYCPH